MTDADLARLLVTGNELDDPLWRLSNLYGVKEAGTGRVVPFRPRPEQMQVFEAVHRHGIKRIVILKARRLGMSTAIDIMAADAVIFNAGVQVSIIDQTQDDASKKLNAICKTAWEFVPEALRTRYVVTRNNDSLWELALADDTKSAVYAGKNARGGTNQILHVSEWGPIQAEDPRRSEEILTGALPSAEHGTVIVETTWKGGRGGHLYSIVKEAMENPEKTARDWHLFFFPWYNDPTYQEEGAVSAIEPEVAKYLAEKEAEIGVKFSDRQKVWYARRRRELGMFIWREFPTTIEECFRAPIEGAIYADLIDQLRAKGAIVRSEIDRSALIHTFWDLGSPVNTVCWYVQLVGSEIRVVDVDLNLDLTVTERVAHMLGKGYLFGHHYLPHDAAALHRGMNNTGRSIQQELEAAGLRNCRVIPRTTDIWIGINRVRQLMPRMIFRLPACEKGIEALSNYHTRRESSSGLAQDMPVHDWSSHAADALRMFAEADAAGMLEGGSATAISSRRQGMGVRVLTGFRGDFGGQARVIR